METGDIQEVAVVGAGLMGGGIALDYALGGLAVSIVGRGPESGERALSTIGSRLHFLVEQGLISEEQRQRAASRLRAASSLEQAVCRADLVVESVPEDMALKREVFSRLESLCKRDAILATNTSGISITRIGLSLRTAHRLVGTHYWNPPYLMPLVEVTAGEKTSPRTVAAVKALLERAGKIPIIVKKDIPGFIWNRLQFALLRECLHLVEQGAASVEDIDLVVRKGLGRRLSLIGPFETADLGGLDVYFSICEYLFPELGCDAVVPGFFADKVRQGELGVKSGKGFYEWSRDKARQTVELRDRRLGNLLREDRQEGGSQIVSHS